MNNKTFLFIHSVIYGLFAFFLFFIPDLLWPVYGVEVNDQYARFLSQHNSIFLGGIAVLCFLFRNIENNNSMKKNLIKGLMGTNILGVIITLYACLTNIFVGFGWSDPAFFFLLTMMCLFQLKKQSSDI